MAFYFSATNLSFYNTEVFPSENLPSDSIEITEEVYYDLLSKQNNGYVILANASGEPYAVKQGCGSCSCLKNEVKFKKVEFTESDWNGDETADYWLELSDLDNTISVDKIKNVNVYLTTTLAGVEVSQTFFGVDLIINENGNAIMLYSLKNFKGYALISYKEVD